MAKTPGPLSEGKALSGYALENNGEDNEYLEALGKAMKDKPGGLVEVARRLIADSEKQTKGPLTEQDPPKTFEELRDRLGL